MESGHCLMCSCPASATSNVQVRLSSQQRRARCQGPFTCCRTAFFGCCCGCRLTGCSIGCFRHVADNVSVWKSLQQVFASLSPCHPRPGCYTAVWSFGSEPLWMIWPVSHTVCLLYACLPPSICLLRMPCFPFRPQFATCMFARSVVVLLCVGAVPRKHLAGVWTASRRCVACAFVIRPGPTCLIVVIATRAERPHTVWWLVKTLGHCMPCMLTCKT
jgi:hypothetical protein